MNINNIILTTLLKQYLDIKRKPNFYYLHIKLRLQKKN